MLRMFGEQSKHQNRNISRRVQTCPSDGARGLFSLPVTNSSSLTSCLSCRLLIGRGLKLKPRCCFFPKHAKHNGVLTCTLKNYQRFCRPQSYGFQIFPQVFLQIPRYSHGCQVRVGGPQSYGFPGIPISIPIDSQVFLWLSGKGWWPSRLRISRYSYRYSYKIPMYSYGCQVSKGWSPSKLQAIPIGIPIKFPGTPMAVR